MANIQIPDNEWECAEVSKSGAPVAFWTRLAQIVRESKRSYLSLIPEIIMLRLGAGELSFDEYAGLRLYDNQLYSKVSKRAFVGFKALQKIWIQANYRFDFFGLLNNKILTDILLGTYGFPIMPTIAIFRNNIGRPFPFLLRSEEELRIFLVRPEHYPLFGKPISGHQSIGSASIERYDAPNNRLITTMGYGIPVKTFIEYVKAHARNGYLFQKRVSPHAAVKVICGDRLATVRILTIMTHGQPKILRACWKIPAGKNVADNFWRPGNLLAQLDLATGKVMRVVQSQENGFEEVTHHPDTGALLVGIHVPHWQEITQLALESARVVEEIALIGWDIAPVDGGGVIVEINETPDFKLHQLTEQRGMLDDELIGFLAERKQHAAHWLQQSRRKRRVITELVPASPASPTGA